MDPYLERPSLWPDVHHRLVTYAGDQLQAQVGPAYYVAIERRVYLESPEEGQFVPDGVVVQRPPRTAAGGGSAPDPELVVVLDEVEVHEGYLELREVDGDRVVTVIEFLSPANKHAGRGREEYLRKQARVLASEANLVEIDLLRAGQHTAAVPVANLRGAPYCAVVSRARDRRRRGLYRFGLRDRLPRVAIPLREPDPDVALDLPALLAEAYERGAYARRIDYAREPDPPLDPRDAAWVRELLAAG